MFFSLRTLQKMAAADNLIRLQKCSLVKTDYYTEPIYGSDLNILDQSRKWLFDELLSKGMEFELARIQANKTVLYVNSNELQRQLLAVG